MINSTNNIRIVKNSILLTVRFIITMCISFYTSRIVLNALGVEDFGVYNVVGGFVALFASLTDSLGRALSRFITVEISHNDVNKQRQVLSAYFNILFVLLVAILIACEFIGLWYFDNFVNIPISRYESINIVFQLSLISFVFSLLKTPGISMIIASEKSDAYAFFCILEAILKLGIVYLLDTIGSDKLITYILLYASVSAISFILVSYYCFRVFSGFRFVKAVPKCLYKSIFGFASWTLLGISSRVFNLQGIVLIVNKFCGVIVNTAIGIVNQIDAFAIQFVSNLAIAINPQIVKSYTVGEIDYMRQLIVFASKCYSFIVLLYAIPIGVEADYLLSLWLGFTPEYSVVLLRLTFICSLFVVMASPLEVAAQATGNIKKFQRLTSSIFILMLPIAWFVLKLGYNVYIIYSLLVVMYFLILLIQFAIMKRTLGLSYFSYFLNIVYRVLATTCIVSTLTFLVSTCFEPSFFRLCIVSATSIVVNVAFILFMGFNRDETKNIIKLLKQLKRT